MTEGKSAMSSFSAARFESFLLYYFILLAFHFLFLFLFSLRFVHIIGLLLLLLPRVEKGSETDIHGVHGNLKTWFFKVYIAVCCNKNTLINCNLLAKKVSSICSSSVYRNK